MATFMHKNFFPQYLNNYTNLLKLISTIETDDYRLYIGNHPIFKNLTDTYKKAKYDINIPYNNEDKIKHKSYRKIYDSLSKNKVSSITSYIDELIEYQSKILEQKEENPWIILNELYEKTDEKDKLNEIFLKFYLDEKNNGYYLKIDRVGK